MCEVQAVRSGAPLPLGAHLRGNGVNFAIFSRHATGVRLDLFDRAEDAAPARSIILDAARNKTGDIWHVWLEGIRPGQLYGFRIAGPYAPHDGHRFNPNKLVLDPCATAIVPPADRDSRFAVGYDPSSPQKDLSFSDVDNAGSAPKCVIPYEDFDWHGDQPLRLPWTSTVIYELHVRGYTIDPSAGVQSPGTYRGLIQKIPYLKDLGVTAVELMPVQEFNEHDSLRVNPKTGERLRNFWGYDPVSFFAPKASYASVRDDGAQVLEFKEMVRAFHREGLEVILDVVFNHTGEGDELGPTLSFRGIDNAIYYWLADDKRYYRNFTGTGQTVNASHPVVRDLILDALRYWVMEMHVDGFRFDLASVLGRDVRGRVLADAPLLERIAEDPILRDAKLIAEAWDAAGAYQVGCVLPAPLGGMERPFPRRRAAVLARGRGHDGPLRQPHLRQLRSVRGIRQGPGVQRQLRHVPRRLHVERSGELLAKTQRGQRRGQSRRRRTRTSARTTASKANPRTRPSRPFASGRSRTSC